MKKHGSARITVLAAAVFCLLTFTAGAGAQTWKVGDNVTATLSGGTLTISGRGKMSFHREFDNIKSSVTNVVIENGVTSIDKFAFDDFDKLRVVTIPGSVTSIGEYAFSGCKSLLSVVIPNGVTSNRKCFCNVVKRPQAILDNKSCRSKYNADFCWARRRFDIF